MGGWHVGGQAEDQTNAATFISNNSNDEEEIKRVESYNPRRVAL